MARKVFFTTKLAYDSFSSFGFAGGGQHADVLLGVGEERLDPIQIVASCGHQLAQLVALID